MRDSLVVLSSKMAAGVINALGGFADNRTGFDAVAAKGGEWVAFARSISRTARVLAPLMDAANEPAGRRWTTRLTAALTRAEDEFETLTAPCQSEADESSARGYLNQFDWSGRLLAVLEPLHGFVADLTAVCELPTDPNHAGHSKAGEAGQRVPSEGAERTTHEPQTPEVSVTKTEFAVLSALAKSRHQQLLNVDIEVAANLSKQTVTVAMKTLISKNLVCRPNGKKKGATLTPAGLALLDQVRSSSVDHP